MSLYDALPAAVAQGLIGDDRPVVALLDVTGIEAAVAGLRSAFATPGTPPVTHSFAVKASPLVPILRLLAAHGIGAEVASPGELALARAAGMPADRIVLDSPVKTMNELREALALGIAVNADNPQELSRIDALVTARPTASALGLRINPQTGNGTIGAMSTATVHSKFGVALRDPGAEEWIVAACADRPWLTRLHVHSGSQGVPLELLAAGVRATYDLAERVNTTVGRAQITTIDIGGGLPVNFSSDEVRPGFRAYADVLRATVPGLFDGRYRLVTEFGRALLAKQGAILARVEYVKSAGGRAVAISHAGAQVATRTVFAPEAWPLRVLALDPRGYPKGGPPLVQDVAGPCCFAGDLLARERPLPRLDAGDLVALLDTGAYYFSNPFAYNSLPRPAVYGFAPADGSVVFGLVRGAQSPEDLLTEGGSAYADALIRLRA